MQLVTVKTFIYAHEGAIAKARLEAEGILCFLKDEFTIQMNPFYSNALGGVKLQVRKEDEETAKKILEETEVDDQQDIEQMSVSDNGNGSAKMTCPYCGSHEVAAQRRPSGVLFAIPVLLFGFPIPFLSRRYHCFNCARDFKKKS